MRSILLACALFTVASCSKAAEPTPAPAPALAASKADPAVPAHLELAPGQRAFCPRQWNCDANNRWYSTRGACLTACTGGTCTADANCSLGGCICP